MANIYVCLRIFKNQSLIGGSLLQTVLILAGNRTQVTFSGIIPLDPKISADTVNAVPVNKN